MRLKLLLNGAMQIIIIIITRVHLKMAVKTNYTSVQHRSAVASEHLCVKTILTCMYPSVLWHRWLRNEKGTQPVHSSAHSLLWGTLSKLHKLWNVGQLNKEQ